MNIINRILEAIASLFNPYRQGNPTGDLPSPRADIDPDDVVYDRETKTLAIKNIEPEVTITTVQNTNSMERLIDVGHIVVLSNSPKYMDDLEVGDIIIWHKPDGARVIHQIIKTGQDSLGWYCNTQGLNIPREDGVRIRRENIESTGLIDIWSKGKDFYRAQPGD